MEVYRFKINLRTNETDFLIIFCLSIFSCKLDKKDADTSELSNRIEINKHEPQQHFSANIKASPDLL